MIRGSITSANGYMAVRSARHNVPLRALATAAPSTSTPRLRTDKRAGDISDVFTSFSGKKAQPLHARYRELKKNLTAGLEEQLQKSWDDLVEVLKVRTEEVAQKRESVSRSWCFAEAKH